MICKSHLLLSGVCGLVLLFHTTPVRAVNLALQEGVQLVGVIQEGGRIYWRFGSREDVGLRLHDDRVTNTSSSSLLWINPLSLIAYRGTGYYFGGVARGVTEIEIVEKFQRVVDATVYYDGGYQEFSSLTPAGAGTHSTILKLDRPVDTRFIYVDFSAVDRREDSENYVDILELRVEGLEITRSSLKAVAHTLRGSHWTFVGEDFVHNWATIASTLEGEKFSNAYNSANLMGDADSLDVDLGTPIMTSAVGINQAPTLMNGNVYNMIRQARLEFSNDADFRMLIATRLVDLDNFRTFQLLDYQPVKAQYVRLSVRSLYRGDINELGISGVVFAAELPMPIRPEPPHVLSVEQDSVFNPVRPGDPYSLTVRATHPDGLDELSVMIWRSRYVDHRGRDERMAHLRLLPTGQPDEFRASFVIPEMILGGNKRLPDGNYQLVVTGFRNYQPIGTLCFAPGPGANWAAKVEPFDFPQKTRPLDITLRVRNRRGTDRTINYVINILGETGKLLWNGETGTLEIATGQTVSQSLAVRPLPHVTWYHLEVVLTEPLTGAEQVITLKRKVPTPKDTIELERLEQLVSQNPHATYSPERVISPPMAIAIRQEHPERPRYQEGLTYTFLIHSMKFPKMTRLDNGRIVLLSSGWLHDDGGEGRAVLIMFSDDDGKSWSQPREIPGMKHRPRPVCQGGQRLVACWDDLTYSDDGGKTWGESRSHLFRLPNGQATSHHGSILAEGDDLTIVTASEAPPHGPTGWTGHSWLWRSHDAGRTWDLPIQIPEEWHTSEGSVTRATDGALVCSFRTNQAIGLPSYCDHFRRITTARSLDNGRTWTDHQVHFRYGKVHTKLLTLRNGDILMTYAVRMGELEGDMYHGIEAVLSHDNGRTWDWDNRFILFRWAMHQAMHSPDSLELADGRILTLFTYHYHPSWGKGALGAPGYALGMTSAVIWSPK